MENKEYFSEKGKEYREENKEKVSELGKVWRKANKNKMNKYFRDRKQNNPGYRISCNLRNRINRALRRKFKLHMKPGSAIKDLGCSVNELVKHLEQQFQPEMSWNTYGNGEGFWNIDHKLALANVDLTNREEFLKVCHYTNLQPLWAKDNIIKGNRI